MCIRDRAKASRVLENWVKVYPESAEALSILGSNYILYGNRLDEALDVFERLNELQEAGTDSLVSQAKIYRLKGEKDKALKVLRKYQEIDKDNADPLLEMAEVYLQFGDIDEAFEKFDEASLMSFNDIDAELGLANIMAMRGEFDASLAAFDGLMRKAETDQDRVKILSEKEMVLYLTGQLKSAMAVLDDMRTVATSFMPPLQQTLMFGSKELSYWAHLQELDKAMERLAAMREETKPPFDGFLYIMERNIHDLMEDEAKAKTALTQFEAFLQEFKTPIYDQFVLSAKAVDKRRAADFAAAIQLHDQAIDLAQQSFLHLNSLHLLDELMYQKAKTLHVAGEHEDALSILDEILHRNPLYGQCMMLKAEVHQAMGDDDLAMAAIAQAKTLWQQADPEYIQYQRLLDLEANLLAEAN